MFVSVCCGCSDVVNEGCDGGCATGGRLATCCCRCACDTCCFCSCAGAWTGDGLGTIPTGRLEEDEVSAEMANELNGPLTERRLSEVTGILLLLKL